MNVAKAVRSRTPALLHCGFTMVEMMVGLTLGMIVLAVVTMVFVTTSNNRHDTERVGRQIENGRYAVQVLADDLVNAGYFGEYDASRFPMPGALPNPCTPDPVVIDVTERALRVHVQGYGSSVAEPACILDRKPSTALVVVRRVATCVAGEASCDAVTNGEVYFQYTLCKQQREDLAFAGLPPYVFATAPGAFTLTKRDCVTPASLRKYEVRIYFVANNNKAGDGIPTLKRAELRNGKIDAETTVPLVEGIENLQIEYGLDNNAPVDSIPDVLTADPGSVGNWTNAVTARIYLLSRTTEMTAGQKDVKTYSLGTDENGTPITVGPFNDKYKRHVYSQTVRMNNPAGRRE